MTKRSHERAGGAKEGGKDGESGLSRGAAARKPRGAPARKRGEKDASQRETERRLLLALDCSGDGVWDWDMTTDKVYYSPRWKELMGYAEDELGDTFDVWRQLVFAEDLERTVADIRRHVETGAPFVTEFRMRCKDGGFKWLLGRGKVTDRSVDGRPLRMIGTNTDITERKAVEGKLRESEHRYNRSIELTGLIGWKTRADGQIEDMPVWRSFTGQSTDEVRGWGWLDAIHPDDRKHSALAWQTAVDTKSPYETEYRVRRHDGAYLNFIARGIPVLGLAGDIVEWVGVCIDITERKVAEEKVHLLNATLEQRIRERTAQLEEAKAAAESANRAKGAFLAAMSHEIRTPMNAVLNMISTVLDSPLGAEPKEYLRVADSSARHLLSVINDILDFSKIESGKLETEDIPFSLHGLLEGVCDLFRTKVAESHVELVLDLAPGTPDGVRGDPTRLRQILVNLIGNAFKFTARGQVVLHASADGGRLRLAVADSGIGIAPEHQGRLFQPFMQADAATTRRFGGTGLGLTISRRLAELMGGGVTLSSVLGEGSVFTVDLPLHPDGAGDRGELRLPLPLQGRVVLLIEDNAATREAVRVMLERHGLACVSFPAVEPALEWLKSPAAGELGAAFVDWLLPGGGMDGLAGIGELRRVRAGLPCFLVSAFADRAAQDQAHAAGAAAFIPKPVTWVATHAALQAALAPKEEPAPPPPVAATAAFPGTLALLAEDNPQNQLVAKVLLKKMGITVEVAENGRIALDKAQAEPGKYQVILMDMQMPEMDGLEATRQIRAAGERIPALKGIPIVAMTANAMKSDLDACLAAGMDGFVTKPIDKAALAAALAKVLPSPS